MVAGYAVHGCRILAERDSCIKHGFKMRFFLTVFAQCRRLRRVQPLAGKGDGVEIRRFSFHLFGVMKSHATSSYNRCAGLWDAVNYFTSQAMSFKQLTI